MHYRRDGALTPAPRIYIILTRQPLPTLGKIFQLIPSTKFALLGRSSSFWLTLLVIHRLTSSFKLYCYWVDSFTLFYDFRNLILILHLHQLQLLGCIFIKKYSTWLISILKSDIHFNLTAFPTIRQGSRSFRLFSCSDQFRSVLFRSSTFPRCLCPPRSDVYTSVKTTIWNVCIFSNNSTDNH